MIPRRIHVGQLIAPGLSMTAASLGSFGRIRLPNCLHWAMAGDRAVLHVGVQELRNDPTARVAC